MNDDSNEIINSHIQMPEMLLKQFHNTNHTFYYYDVEGNFIGTKGRANSTNTEDGYYSKGTETYFGKEVETPLGKILKYIEDEGFDNESLIMPYDINYVAKKFISALVCRSPSYLSMMLEDNPLLKNLSSMKLHDYVVKVGLDIALEHDVYSDYIVTFLINRTNIPFVLSVSGVYGYTLNGHRVLNLPITPTVALFFVHTSYSERVVNADGSINMFELGEPEKIMAMNQSSFRTQIKQNWGRVVCPQRVELDRLKQLHDSNQLA